MELKFVLYSIHSVFHTLLIVPYGIEMTKMAFIILKMKAFNCTLWN